LLAEYYHVLNTTKPIEPIGRNETSDQFAVEIDEMDWETNKMQIEIALKDRLLHAMCALDLYTIAALICPRNQNFLYVK